MRVEWLVNIDGFQSICGLCCFDGHTFGHLLEESQQDLPADFVVVHDENSQSRNSTRLINLGSGRSR